MPHIDLPVLPNTVADFGIPDVRSYIFFFVAQSRLPNAGLGLFSRQVFAPGSILTVYDGVVQDKLFLERAHDTYGDQAYSHAHAIPGTSYTVVGLKCITFGRGLGSFANHSSANNARIVTKRGRYPYFNAQECPFLDRFLALQATQQIENTDEIYVRYPKSTLCRLGISPK